MKWVLALLVYSMYRHHPPMALFIATIFATVASCGHRDGLPEVIQVASVTFGK